MTKEAQRETSEAVLANDMSYFLAQTYPNHSWAVCVDSVGGIAKIIEKDLMQPNMPYVINLKDSNYSHKKLQKMLVTAGGELL